MLFLHHARSPIDSIHSCNPPLSSLFVDSWRPCSLAGCTNGSYRLMAKKKLDKSPAFQLYPKEWLSCSTVMRMTPRQEGGYIRLICLDWQDDGILDDRTVIAYLSRLNDDELDLLLGKFIAHPKKADYLTHPRVQKERRKQKENRRKKSVSGKKGAQKRWSKDTQDADNQGAYEASKGDGGANGGAKKVPMANDSSPSSIAFTSTTTEESISKDILKGYIDRINQIFNRRPSTNWKPKEIKELKSVGEIEEEDFLLLEKYYAFDHPAGNDYRRQKLSTFVNNLRDEIDRAKRWKPPAQHGDNYSDDAQF